MFHAYTNIIKLLNRVANHYGKLQGGTLSDYWVSRCHQPTPSMSDYSLQEVIVTVKYFSWDHKPDLGHTS